MTPEQSFIRINDHLYRLSSLKNSGFSDTYKANSTRKNKPELTIKVLQKKFNEAANVRRQFLTEIQIVASLNEASTHSNAFIQFSGRGHWQDSLYFAYQHINGLPLLQFAKPTTFKLEDACHIILQLLEQLDNLHTRQNSIIHGDISAENILVTPNKTVYLIDFGCAHFTKSARAHSYQWLAKPSYLSPEQARGETWLQSSDIYQVGIIMYEMIRKRRWNTGKSQREKMLFAATIKSPKTNFLCPHLKNSLSEWLAGLLQSNPEHRPTAANALASLREII